MIHYLANFDALIKRGFWVIPKITIDILCKPIDDVTIAFSTFWNFKTLGKKEEIYKTLNIGKSNLGEI